MTAKWVRAGVAKEFRALWLPWAACLGVIAGSALLPQRAVRDVALPAYFLGMAALGALSIGHEYSHRTLGSMLSQPVRRESQLLMKMGVLGVLLVTLSGLARLLVARFAGPFQPEMFWTFVLPVFYALLLAPWLSMACRSAMAATLFTVVLPGLLVLGADIATSGDRSADAQSARMVILLAGTLGLCAAGAILTWRTFMRLETTDVRGAELRLPWLGPRSAEAPPNARRPVLWMLVTKELRLQQMALVVTILYLLVWLAAAAGSDIASAFTVVTAFYAIVVSLLIGSHTSAEERRLGTLEWQTLLPLAAWKQWTVKVAGALGLALLLTAGLPLVLRRIAPAIDVDISRPLAIVVMVLTTLCIYVSSLCRGGLWALLISLPTVLGVVLLGLYILDPVVRGASYAVARASRQLGHDNRLLPSIGLSNGLLLIGLLVAGLLALALRFAHTNHRYSGPVPRRALTQTLWMAGYVVMAISLLAAVGL